jgi:hypothetical protein
MGKSKEQFGDDFSGTIDKFSRKKIWRGYLFAKLVGQKRKQSSMRYLSARGFIYSGTS